MAVLKTIPHASFAAHPPGGGAIAVIRTRMMALWLVWLSLLGSGAGVALAEAPKEYQLKAVFLWRLGQFTEWPTNSFTNGQSPLVIGVLGANPFGDALELAVRDETAHGRKVRVEYFRSVSAITTCHVLFINESDPGKVLQIISSLGHRTILTVSDAEEFTRAHGMVRFMTEKKKVRLRINLEAVTAAHLVIDSRVLRAAEIVEDK